MAASSVNTTSTGGVAPAKGKQAEEAAPAVSATDVKTIKLAVYADDQRDPELIGEGKVDLTSTLKTGEFDEWVTITNKGKYSGEVYLEMTYYPAVGSFSTGLPIPQVLMCLSATTQLPPPDKRQVSGPVRAGVHESGAPVPRRSIRRPSANTSPSKTPLSMPMSPPSHGARASSSHGAQAGSVDLNAVPLALRVGQSDLSPRRASGMDGNGLPMPGEVHSAMDASEAERRRIASFGRNQGPPLPPRAPSRGHSLDDPAAMANSLARLEIRQSLSADAASARPPMLSPEAGAPPSTLNAVPIGHPVLRPHRHSVSSFWAPENEQAQGGTSARPDFNHGAQSDVGVSYPSYPSAHPPSNAGPPPQLQQPYHGPQRVSSYVSQQPNGYGQEGPPAQAQGYSMAPPTLHQSWGPGVQPPAATAARRPLPVPDSRHSSYGQFAPPAEAAPIPVQVQAAPTWQPQPQYAQIPPQQNAPPPAQLYPAHSLSLSPPPVAPYSAFQTLPPGHHLSTFPAPTQSIRYASQSLPPPPAGQLPIPIQEVLRAASPLPLPPPPQQQPYFQPDPSQGIAHPAPPPPQPAYQQHPSQLYHSHGFPQTPPRTSSVQPSPPGQHPYANYGQPRPTDSPQGLPGPHPITSAYAPLPPRSVSPLPPPPMGQAPYAYGSAGTFHPHPQ